MPADAPSATGPDATAPTPQAVPAEYTGLPASFMGILRLAAHDPVGCLRDWRALAPHLLYSLPSFSDIILPPGGIKAVPFEDINTQPASLPSSAAATKTALDRMGADYWWSALHAMCNIVLESVHHLGLIAQTALDIGLVLWQRGAATSA